MSDPKAMRDKFLNQGAELVKDELDCQATYVIEVQNKTELKNIEILSDNLLAKKNLHGSIKKQVHEYGDNIKKIILATAYYIETDQYASVDEKVAQLDLNKFDKNRVTSLITAQKKLSGSFQTLTVVLDIFRKVNESILAEIQKTDNTPANKTETLRLYLKNSVLVYELTNFAMNFLNEFGLNGINDLIAVQKDVFDDLERGDKKDEELEKSLSTAPQNLKDATIKDINNRREVRSRVKEKWQSIMNQIGVLQENTSAAKTFVDHLKIIKQNAANQIDIISIIATTQVVQSTIEAVNAIADVSKFQLAPLDGKKACELLGIEV